MLKVMSIGHGVYLCGVDESLAKSLNASMFSVNIGIGGAVCFLGAQSCHLKLF
jgi:hypothetical protein